MLWKWLFGWIGKLWKRKGSEETVWGEGDTVFKNHPEPEPYRWDGHKFILPGGVVFDRAEFRQFQKDHPEYSRSGTGPKYTVKTHPGGIVGITPKGFKDPGPSKEILGMMEKEEES
jgi:hypothetical protein